MINATKYPELHIRDVNATELAELRVRCILQSIVDESREIKKAATRRLKSLAYLFSYDEVRCGSTDVNVLAVSNSTLLLMFW